MTGKVIDPKHFFSTYFILPPLVSAVVGTVGYLKELEVIVDPPNKPRHICAVFTDLQTQAWSSTKKVWMTFRASSLDYTLMLITVALLWIVKGYECVQLAWELSTARASHTDSVTLALASRLSRFARLGVWVGVMATLKELADSNLLVASDYPSRLFKVAQSLNVWATLGFASLAGYLLGTLWVVGSLVKNRSGAGNVLVALLSLLFSGICAYNAFLATLSTRSTSGDSPSDTML